MALLKPPFWPQKSPKKFMWAPFLRPFPGNEAHKLFFWGPQLGCFGWGPKSLCWKSLCAFSVPPFFQFFFFFFLRIACSLGIPQENPLNLIKSPIFTNTPCKSTCLYSLHLVCTLLIFFGSRDPAIWAKPALGTGAWMHAPAHGPDYRCP